MPIATASTSVEDAVNRRRGDLVELSHSIHAYPELAFAEHRSCSKTQALVAERGFTITQQPGGLDTAFRADFGSGSLVIGICAEYDALPGIGHACGHNIIAAAAVGAGRALAGVADELGLTVTVLGTPAEEGGGGKVFMLERGAFDGLHAAMMVHPGPVDVAEARPFAVSHMLVRYQGKATHAAAYPEQGINAADAFTVAQVAIGLLRQQLLPSTRVHGVVTHAGDAPNIIPEATQGRWYVRAESLDELATLEPKIRRCFEAGALATGCELEIGAEAPPYAEFRNDPDLLPLYRANAERLGREFLPSDGSGAGGMAGRMNRASTDMGNVSLVVPSIHPYIGIDSLPAVNHQKEFAAHCITAAAAQALLDGATGLAWTATDAARGESLRTRQ